MSVITEHDIRNLASFTGERAPVTSCYLDVDGRRYIRPHDYELHLDAMLRKARERSPNGNRTAQDSVEADLRRIAQHAKSGIDRSRTRGVAIFSCTAHDFWRVIELPVPVRNRVVINHTPYVRELESVIDEYDRFAVLLADRQRARLFLFELGQLVEKQEEFDQLPRHDDDRGDWTRDHVSDHSAALAHKHFRRAAQAAFALFQEHGFDHLILGVPEELAGEMEQQLHSYLRDRIAARITVPVAARDADIRQAALEVETEIERRKEAAGVQRLRDAVGAGAGGVAGLDAVLEALVARRVHTLLVSEGFEAPGWRCRSCSYVGTRGRACPVCEVPMDPVDDVVEEALEEALAQRCRVELCRGNADLDVLGRIGALLRF